MLFTTACETWARMMTRIRPDVGDLHDRKFMFDRSLFGPSYRMRPRSWPLVFGRLGRWEWTTERCR